MKRLISILLATTMIPLSLAACVPTASPPASSAAPSAASAEAGASAQAGTEPVTIRVMHYMSEQTKRDGFAAITKAYTDANPNIIFEVESMPEAQYMSTLQTRIASGDAPDILFGRPNSMAHLVEAGQIYSLEGQPVLKQLSQSELESVSVKGVPCGVPLDSMVMGVFYNKDLFAENGYTVPKTYDEFMAIVKGFSNKGIAPFVRAFKDMNYPRIDFDSQFRQIVIQEDVSFYTEIQAGNKKFADYPFFKKALEDFAERLDVKSDDDMGTDPTRAIQLFAGGNYPMLITGSWIVGDLRKHNANGNYGFFPIPSSNDAATAAAAVGIDDTFMISAQTKVSAECVAFFSYMKTPEAATLWYNNARVMTPGVNDPNLDPLFQDMTMLADGYKLVSLDNYLYFTGEARTRFTQYLQLFASTSDKNVDKFIADLDKEFASIIK